jgi:O-antigen/teichoic acid export membrane protein
MLSKSVYLEKKANIVFLLCTALNIGLNFIAIPLWSAEGAAWATFITETILAILLVRLNVRELQVLKSKENNSSPPSPLLAASRDMNKMLL